MMHVKITRSVGEDKAAVADMERLMRLRPEDYMTGEWEDHNGEWRKRLKAAMPGPRRCLWARYMDEVG